MELLRVDRLEPDEFSEMELLWADRLEPRELPEMELLWADRLEPRVTRNGGALGRQPGT